MYKNFLPLTRYLSEKTGLQVEIVFAPNYTAHIRNIGTGRVDLGYLGPSPYVKVKDHFGSIELLAQIKTVDEINNRMVIITRKDSPLARLEDLKGRSFAFGDYQSFGSHFMPGYILLKHGISLNDLRIYDFVRSHDNVVLSVLHGDFDAGGVREDIFNKYRNRNVRVLAGPFPIPPHVIVVRKDVPMKIREKLRNALFHLSNRQILKRVNPYAIGFAPVHDSDFDFARRVLRVMEEGCR
jgi:phosphonate transport system substrate-binding protein